VTHPNTLRHLDALVKDFIDNKPDFSSLLLELLQAALAGLMEAEVEQFTGAPHSVASSERLTRRNGYRQRRFDTGLGTLALQIPKLRQGTYFPSFLQARQRSDQALVAAVAQCYQQGASTRNVEAIAQALGVENLDKNTVSRMAETLQPMIDAFKQRPLPACPYVFLDARYEFVREDHEVQRMAVLIAMGVRQDGMKEVLGYAVARTEHQTHWADLLRELKRRGLTGVKLVISDAHEGLRAAIEQELSGAKWQRCKVHWFRNLSGHLPEKKRAALMTLTKTIFEQDSQEEALVQRRAVAQVFRQAGCEKAADFLESTVSMLTYMTFPREHWRQLHSTNVIERLNRELKRRTRVVSIFPHRDSLDRLVGALLIEEHEEWMIGRRYIAERSMARLKSTTDQLDQLVPGASNLLTQAAK
jgi:putative transposase